MDEFHSIIKGLDEKRREIVTLKILGGYTHKEIAQMTGKPQGTVRWLYNTAIKKLKYLLTSMSAGILLCLGFSAEAFRSIYYVLVRSDMESGTTGRKPPLFSIETEEQLMAFLIAGGIAFLLGIVLSILWIKLYKKSDK